MRGRIDHAVLYIRPSQETMNVFAKYVGCERSSSDKDSDDDRIQLLVLEIDRFRFDDLEHECPIARKYQDQDILEWSFREKVSLRKTHLKGKGYKKIKKKPMKKPVDAPQVDSAATPAPAPTEPATLRLDVAAIEDRQASYLRHALPRNLFDIYTPRYFLNDQLDRHSIEREVLRRVERELMQPTYPTLLVYNDDDMR
jgi:hypothetical protein